MLRTALVATQAATFIALGVVLLAEGAWKLGLAQLCLACVTGLVYW